MSWKPELWGNFIGAADRDVLAVGVLVYSENLGLAIYHGVQAVEKYLKALCLSIRDPTGLHVTPESAGMQWIKTHNLGNLAANCASIGDFYNLDSTKSNLERFTECDQRVRYPWAKVDLSGLISSEDITLLLDYIKQIRNDIPITYDDYFLGLAIRDGISHRNSTIQYEIGLGTAFAVSKLREIRPDLDDFVKWSSIS
jgi:hypothetical protein